MSLKQQGLLIFGTATNGHRFRPSDWVDRLATACGSFDASRRIRYHALVKPTRSNGERCLFVAHELAATAPELYDYIMGFAHGHRLQVADSCQADPYRSAA